MKSPPKVWVPTTIYQRHRWQSSDEMSLKEPQKAPKVNYLIMVSHFYIIPDLKLLIYQFSLNGSLAIK